jgi:sugar phosphate isomerase/epimerase
VLRQNLLFAIYFQQLAVNEEATMQTRFSFQLYCARNEPAIEPVLAMVAKHGYKEVEGYGPNYEEPEKLRKMLDAHGLTMPTGHFSIDMLEKKKAAVLHAARVLGINIIAAPFLMPDDRPKTAKGWKDFGKRLNKVCETYRAEGFGVAWHNHDFEFVKLKDGSYPHNHMFSTAPLLDWEIDIAWVVRGKANPLKFIKKYAGAITVAHLKDIAAKGEKLDEDGWADLGHGTIDWKACMAALKGTRCMHYVLEHDKPNDVGRFLRRSIASAKKL